MILLSKGEVKETMILTQENGKIIYVNPTKIMSMREFNGETYIIQERGSTFVRESLIEILKLMDKECNIPVAKHNDFIYQRFMAVD